MSEVKPGVQVPQENPDRVLALFQLVRASFPKDVNMIEVLRVGELLVSDVIVQSRVPDESKEKTLEEIKNDISNFSANLKKDYESNGALNKPGEPVPQEQN